MSESVNVVRNSFEGKLYNSATAEPPLQTRPSTFTGEAAWHLFVRLCRDLVSVRRSPQFGRLEAAVLAVYACLLVWCVPHHESWFDEVQAWLIARDSSLVDLFVHRLHYEGTPGLWHLLLWAVIRLGAPLFGMQVLAASFAIAGIYVWLRYNPLPRMVGVLMPFTFFLQYQFAVVARSYVLVPLFAYVMMALYQNRKSSPMAFCIVAGLFANCSVHMAALSMGLSLLYLHDRLWNHTGETLPMRKLCGPAVVLCVLVVAAALTAVPTADGSSTSANPIVTAVRTSVSTPGSLQQNKAREEDLSTSVHLAQPPPQSAWAQSVWRAMQSGNQTDNPVSRWMSGRSIRHLLVFATATTASVSTSNAAAIVFLLLLGTNILLARQWITMLPWLLVQAVNVLVAGEAHHFGLLWIAITCSLWALSIEQPRKGAQTLLRNGLFAYLLVIMAMQVSWSMHAIFNDVRKPYSSGEQAAAYLGALPSNLRVAAFDDDSVTVNAYLSRSPYVNQHVDYWPFSCTTDPSLSVAAVMSEKPDVVSVKMSAPDHPVMDQWVKMTEPGVEYVSQVPLKYLTAYNYRETHRFCGQRFFRDTAESTDCRLIFERSVRRHDAQ